MAEKFFDSVYRYTDPIRYFKANDPYYYEVDNIPLKQLQENCNFLKDQVSNLVENPKGTIDRKDFTELKPYVDGTDNRIKVNPGRYTARINDAYSIQPLQYLQQLAGFNAGETNVWSTKSNISLQVSSILNRFKQDLVSNATHMNGLFERAFTFAMQTPDIPSTYISSSIQGYTLNEDGNQTPYPAVTGRNLIYQTQFSSINIAGWNSSYGFLAAAANESDFIKRWRGVTRTAVVDVKEELVIDIPPFNANDFYYIDESNLKVNLPATQRIDLLFLYSKPIDTSAVTINKFVNNVPVKINKPVLGIVKGAGLGVNFSRLSGLGKAEIQLFDSDGNQLILPNIADANGENVGFSGVKGSFPSPDDLMNITPLLSENLETNSFALIGQSILPLAYIVVKQNAAINQNSNFVLEQNDLIDIRPFFRTTELSYNERSGLAAATPPASLANPVVTEAYVDDVARVINNRITEISNPLLAPTPRIVAAGYIKGGALWGVESTLMNYINTANPNQFNNEELKSKIIEIYDYPNGTTINDRPDWDLSKWCVDLPVPNKGGLPHDYINFAVNKSGAKATYGYSNSIGGKSFSTFPSLGTDGGNFNFYYVSKTIRIDKSQVPWMSDYRVDVKFHNCVPLSQRRGYEDTSYKDAAAISNVWVSKKNENNNYEFTIFVSWPALDAVPDNLPGDLPISPFVNREPAVNAVGGVINFNGFAVITKDIMSEIDISTTSVIRGDSRMGVCLYPTVSFEVIGIPESFEPQTNFQANNTLSLR